eukprot:423210_1
MTDFWVGNPDTNSENVISKEAIVGVLNWPICDMTITSVRVIFISKTEGDDGDLLTGDCVNNNKFNDITCNVQQEYEEKFTYSYEYQLSKSTESTVEYQFTNAAKLSIGMSMSTSKTKFKSKVNSKTTGLVTKTGGGIYGGGVDQHSMKTAGSTNGQATTVKQEQSLEAQFSTSSTETQSVAQKDGEIFINGEETSNTKKISCSSSIKVKPLQSVLYSIEKKEVLNTFQTFTDIRLTKCSYYYDESTNRDNNLEHFIFIRDIPGNIKTRRSASCSIQYEQTQYIEKPMTCADALRIKYINSNTYIGDFANTEYIPLCNPDNNLLWDGCQCDNLKNPSKCQCVD